jgi:hypothetical protein
MYAHEMEHPIGEIRVVYAQKWKMGCYVRLQAGKTEFICGKSFRIFLYYMQNSCKVHTAYTWLVILIFSKGEDRWTVEQTS